MLSKNTYDALKIVKEAQESTNDTLTKINELSTESFDLCRKITKSINDLNPIFSNLFESYRKHKIIRLEIDIIISIINSTVDIMKKIKKINENIIEYTNIVRNSFTIATKTLSLFIHSFIDSDKNNFLYAEKFVKSASSASKIAKKALENAYISKEELAITVNLFTQNVSLIKEKQNIIYKKENDFLAVLNNAKQTQLQFFASLGF